MTRRLSATTNLDKYATPSRSGLRNDAELMYASYRHALRVAIRPADGTPRSRARAKSYR